MTETVIVIGSIAFFALLALSILWFVRRAFVKHDPNRAAASVPVAADAPFELPLPGSPGKLFFRFAINGSTDGFQDLLVSGEIVDEHGSTRAFAVRTSQHSQISGAKSARYTGTMYAVTDSTGSISLAAAQPGDRAVRGVVAEHPSGFLREGWVYLPRGA